MGNPEAPLVATWGRPGYTQSRMAGKASMGSSQGPTEGREETKLPGRRFSLECVSSLATTHV